MKSACLIVGLLLIVSACLAETIDGSRLTVVNAPIARARLGISNEWVIALGTNSVRIEAGANVTITTNVTGSNVIYTIASTGGGGGSISSNANQFLGVPLSIKHNAQLSNVMVWPSNNLTTSLVVTSTPGSTANLLEAQNTNRTGLVIGSNGYHTIRASVPAAAPTVTILNLGGNQTMTIWSNSFAGNGSFLMRTDNAGNAVFSPGNAGGETYFGGPDSGSGIVNFSLTTVGSVWRMIPSASVAAWHGSTLRRGQLSNVWDIFIRSNIVYSEVGGTDTISLKSPSGIAAPFVLTWPNSNGLAGQMLYNSDGAGALAWKDDATAGGSNVLAVLTNGTVASSTVTQINVVNANGLRFDAANTSGALTLTAFQTNAYGLVWTNSGGDNVSQTNNVVFTPLIATNITGNSDGLTVVEPGNYLVSAQVSYALTGNDTLTIVLTTNNTDYTPSMVRTFFNTTSGGAPTFTNYVSTTTIIRLAASDRIRLRRWYGNGAGNLFRQLDANMTAHRIGDY